MMAKPVKTTRTAAKAPPLKRQATSPKAKLGTPPSAKTPQGTGKASKPSVAPLRKPSAAVTAPATAAPKLSKDELRAMVEKQAATIATLRTKAREANKAIKATDGRIADLEAELAGLQKQVAAQSTKSTRDQPTSVKRIKAAPAKQATAAKATPGQQPSGNDVDPGDAVPPGVAVQQPEPLDAAAVAAKAALEENLARD